VLARLDATPGVARSEVEASGQRFRLFPALGADAAAIVTAARNILGENARVAEGAAPPSEEAIAGLGGRWFGSGDALALTRIEARLYKLRIVMSAAREGALQSPSDAKVLGEAAGVEIGAALLVAERDGSPRGDWFTAAWPTISSNIIDRCRERLGPDGVAQLASWLGTPGGPGHVIDRGAMTDETDGLTLDAQQRHWEGMLASRAEMFGPDPSGAARRSAPELQAAGLHRLLELGGGQGRDSLFFAANGFSVHVLDYSQAGIDTVLKNATEAGLQSRLSAQRHDVRRPLPVSDATFDACYSHMLFCMAFTAAELERLAGEVRRALRPGGQCIYTVRHKGDPDYGRGVHRGEDLYESNGFIVHYFDRAKVERLARGFVISSIDELEEGKLPRRLYRVAMRKA